MTETQATCLAFDMTETQATRLAFDTKFIHDSTSLVVEPGRILARTHGHDLKFTRKLNGFEVEFCVFFDGALAHSETHRVGEVSDLARLTIVTKLWRTAEDVARARATAERQNVRAAAADFFGW